MKNEDVTLIQQFLTGDENAFVSLVRKYQKQVHALAWRKIGDFHIAEEITQDTFLKVYQKLSTLKDPNQFSGWLYVIATNQCRGWLRKKRIETESLDDTETDWVDTSAYSRYVAEEQAKVNVETQREVVKKLLAKLKESERTVMTLHYFGEMTIEEISRFLGVSVSAIKLRLHRARQRLQKEEPMIREAISNFQLSPNLTDNIMQKVERIKPTPPSSGSKPFIPWVIGASSVLLIVLMLGMGSQYLAYFQRPYSLEAQSEMAVELINVPIVQNLETKLEHRNQIAADSDESEKEDGSGKEADTDLGNDGDYTQWNLPENAKARLGKGRITGNVVYSPDGTRLAVAGSIGIWIYDAQTEVEVAFCNSARSIVQDDVEGELIRPSGHNHHIECIEFSPDGKMLASGDWDNTIVLWDAFTGQQKAVLQTKDGNFGAMANHIRCLSFSSDGKTLASGHGDGNIRLWDVRTAQQTKLLVGHKSHVYCMSFSPTDKKILVSGSSDELWVWNVATGKHQSLYIDPVIFRVETDGSTTYVSPSIWASPSIFALSFSSDGKTLATAHIDDTVRLWDIETMTATAICEGHTGLPESVRFSPDGKTLISGSWDKTVRLWDVSTGKQKTTLTGHTRRVVSVAFSADGSTIASNDDGNTVRLWDATTGKHKSILKGYTPSIRSIEYSPDGTVIASAGSDGTVRLWDTTSRKQKNMLKGHDESVNDVCFSPDGKILLSGSDDNMLCLWNVKTGKLIKKIVGHTDKVTSVSFNGQKIASASDDQIWTWDAATGQHERTLIGHTGIVSNILFSPDGKILASGSRSKTAYAADNSVLLWNVETGKQVARMDGYPQGINDLSFSPDGKILAGASRMAISRQFIYLWNTTTSEPKLLPIDQRIFNLYPDGKKTHSKPVCLSVDFSPNDTILVSSHSDATVRIWNLATEQQVAVFVGQIYGPSSIRFSPDGKTLASASSDGSILLWDFPSMTNTEQHSR